MAAALTGCFHVAVVLEEPTGCRHGCFVSFYYLKTITVLNSSIPCLLPASTRSCAEAGPNRGAEEVHREASVPHPDAGDHTEDAGQRLGAGGRHQEDQGSLVSSENKVFQASWTLSSFINGLIFF